MPPEEEIIENKSDSSGTFAQEVVKEAFGELYTEHVKITLKNSDSLRMSPIYPLSESDDLEKQVSLSTFKKTYFGAQKSQSVDESALKEDADENLLKKDGRTSFFSTESIPFTSVWIINLTFGYFTK